MKRYNMIKTIQLAIFVVLTLLCLGVVLFDSDLFHLVANDDRFRFICMLLWSTLAVSFIFIFLDFSNSSTYKKDFSELDYAVHSDPTAGIANRYSSDMLIEQYLDKKLSKDFGCIMFELTNLQAINALYGHTQGNISIREFSTILRITSVDLCFVGRNGGNKFIALFESGNMEKMLFFLKRIKQKVDIYNETNPESAIEYKFGMSFSAEDQTVTIIDLISLANKRIYTAGSQGNGTDPA